MHALLPMKTTLFKDEWYASNFLARNPMVLFKLLYLNDRRWENICKLKKTYLTHLRFEQASALQLSIMENGLKCVMIWSF